MALFEVASRGGVGSRAHGSCCREGDGRGRGYGLSVLRSIREVINGENYLAFFLLSAFFFNSLAWALLDIFIRGVGVGAGDSRNYCPPFFFSFSLVGLVL